MKKKILSMLLVGTMALSMTACGSGKESGVSEAEYDKVVKERDQYKEELEEIKKKEEESKETKEFKVGETWEVDGKFKVTVNSVIATDYRNQFDESNPAAVYVINYTYENIGLKEDLYVNFESKVVTMPEKWQVLIPVILKNIQNQFLQERFVKQKLR